MRTQRAAQLSAKLTGIRIRQLQLFQTLTEVESISEAARRCNMTQPAATEALKELEKAFTTQLVVRGSRGTSLTPEGEIFAKRVPIILSEIQSLVWGVERARERRESIRLGFISVAMDSGLPELVRRLQKSRVKSCVSLKELNVSESKKALLAGDIDAALTVIQSEFEVEGEEEEFSIVPLSLEHYDVAAPISRARAIPGHWDLEILRSSLWILPSRESFLRRAFDDCFIQNGHVPPAPVVELSPVALAMRMSAHLNALALVSHRTSSERLAAEGLCRIKAPELRLQLRLVLV